MHGTSVPGYSLTDIHSLLLRLGTGSKALTGGLGRVSSVHVEMI